jgi:hypothetical protein
MIEKRVGKRPTESTLKLRDWLKKLTGENFDQADYAAYRKVTHDVKTSRAYFMIEKRKEAQRRGVAVKTRPRRGSPTAPPSPAPAAVPLRGKSIRVLATMPLESYQGVDAKVLKAFAADMLRQIHGRADAVEVRVLAEPLALEITEPA